MLPAGASHHFLSGLLTQQGLAEGGVLRDPPVHGVGLLGAHDLIGQGLVKLQVFHHHVVAHVDDVPGGLLLLDDGVVGQNLVQLCDGSRAYPCSFFASSYSLFSDRSPKERASLMSSATSFSRTVFR